MANNNTINGRIREIILSAGITDSAFAKRIGVTQSVIASMFQRGTEPSAKVLTSILVTYEDISAEWLLRGKGQMLLSEETPDPNIERMERLVDTIATLQGTLNEYMKTNQLLTDELKKAKGELAMLKNERNAG
ncbi:helix-turn-helix domain-containing protein [Bacteroides ovatus]|uniref:helix-turn-helix domain-containing protein n=1 Tax=Bacteroides ovatus TaxID=28116 RepID=UPI001898B313|nr:helix-turn-helix domain-containing protein [Bacteroides ovatus]MDC2623416.1 helix-turn-helix domain-containing protein [Bacteroides ovatus]MDC2637157.1 helix-turn-helix domain-containing protein [Bacteroides ovatus]MDC2653143.1 helix-turn-helix domain-containing protein [Bacteroides ovatus]DAP82432.1 MAG TPA: Helix-turn-helix XRE-family like protein [Caudoviricetes sp.]